ncbi:unnamed protein product [Ceutorhynchus assimilis]|uniref:Uncharacterized protein n=1 Tax=Ceutorhynchus assimilis TaxID=467358 RepID=A0A9N9QST3_9CUCU|nr:unnamed protein product [Ceutorhynchus assimilis]
MNCFQFCGRFIIWGLILCTIAFPIAMFCATVYIILYAISGCCPGCEDFTETVLKGVQLPGTAVRKLVKCD